MRDFRNFMRMAFYRVCIMLGAWMMIVYPVAWLDAKLGILGYMPISTFCYIVAALCTINLVIKVIKMIIISRQPIKYMIVKIDD